MNKLVKVVLVMGVFAIIFGSAGCAKYPNKIESKVKLSAYTQQERQDYVRNYLQQKYQLNCSVSEVKKKQLTAIKNEEFYFATATTEISDLISVWISNDGNVTDTVFLLNMEEDITAFFKLTINNKLPEFKIKTYTEMRDIPSRELTNVSNIRDYLNREDTYTYIRIFVDNATDISDSTLNELQTLLNFCNCSIYIYECDLNDIDTVVLSNYVYSKDVEKE